MQELKAILEEGCLTAHAHSLIGNCKKGNSTGHGRLLLWRNNTPERWAEDNMLDDDTK